MKKLIILFSLALAGANLTGCHINVIRLDNRIEKWHSMKEKKKASAESMVKFANETIYFFLTTIDFQRSREAVIDDAVRLGYHHKLTSIQVFLIDYYARRALEAISGQEKDWEQAALEWARADSLTYGFLPRHEHTFKLVLIDDGYARYIQDIAYQGERYNRMERDYPGLMNAFRKMGTYKFRLAEHLMEQGRRVEALEAYLLVFKRDPENFARAEKAVKDMTGNTIREIQVRRFTADIAMEGFLNLRYELYGSAEGVMANIRAEQGDEAAEQMFPEIMAELAQNFRISPEQAADIYYSTKSEIEGTLPEYIHLWRHEILQGQEPQQPAVVK
jgi:tetratricopeptide (TPR) repeat protein